VTQWTAFERRLRDDILSALLPTSGPTPGFEPEAHAEFWVQLTASAPALLRWGLRASIWAVWGAALLRGRRFSRLTGPERAAVVAGLERSRLYPVRQVPMALKVVLCFAHFQRPAVRAAAES
jgi:hypothetical protein